MDDWNAPEAEPSSTSAAPTEQQKDIRDILKRGASERTRTAKQQLSFPISSRSAAFRKQFFPNASAADWTDWRWQLRMRIRTLAELERVFVLSDDERSAVARHVGGLPVGITAYYASLMDPEDPQEPLRRTHIPVGEEYLRAPGEADDPLSEDHDTATPGSNT